MLAISAACGVQQTVPDTSKTPLCVSYTCAKTTEKNYLVDQTNVMRRDSTLLISPATGPAVAFIDGGDGVDIVSYAYQGFLQDINHHLIAEFGWEFWWYEAVDAVSGAQVSLANRPVISPDRDRVVAASTCFDESYCPTIIEVWRIVAGKLVLEDSILPTGERYPLRFGPEEWGPGEVSWLGPDTFRAQIVRLHTIPIPRDSAVVFRRGPTGWVAGDTIVLRREANNSLQSRD